MKVQPYRETDLPELIDLWNEARRGSYEFIPYTEERLRRELEWAASVLVALDEQGEIIGCALLRRGWYGEGLELCVRPGEQELEGQLLSAIEREVRTGEVTAIVDTEDHEGIEFFTNRGYEPTGSLYQMIAELDRPWLVPPVPQGYLLRGLRPDEDQALIQVVNTAYEGERLRPGALARWREEDPAFDTELVQVAEHEGELVAAVVARADREFNEHYHARRGYLGPAATLPDHRGKGLSKALTARAVNLLRKQGMEQACLYTWSGNRAALRVLRKLGFQVSHEWRFLTRSITEGKER